MNHLEEIKKLGLTGDPDIDEIALGDLTSDEQRQYEKIMADKALADRRGKSHDERMKELAKERDKLTGLARQGFEMRHPDLLAWEAKQPKPQPKRQEPTPGFHFKPAKKKGEEEPVEPFSDEELDAMAENIAFKA